MSDVLNSQAPAASRQVRSFVRREGRATPGQKTAMATLWPKYGVSPVADEHFEFKQMYGRDVPLVLEIGFGDGEALVDAAKRNPDHNYLGAEVYTPGVGHCLLRIEQEQLGNVRLCQEDAISLLKDHIPSSALSEIRLFFPDPWPKKKHHKRRIVNQAFTQLISKRLLVGGSIHFATDWEPYAQWALEEFEKCTALENISGEGRFTPMPKTRIVTKFERRGQRLGHGSWDLIYRLRASNV